MFLGQSGAREGWRECASMGGVGLRWSEGKGKKHESDV